METKRARTLGVEHDMNILVTCFTYAPRRNGVQFVTQYLCEGLVRRGHSVTVITHCHDGLPDRELINGVAVERWPIKTVHMHHTGPKEEYVRRVIKRQEEYDVMLNVCTQTALTDWLLPHFGEIRIPKLLHIHSIWDFEIHPWDCVSISAFTRKLVSNIRWGLYYYVNKAAFRSYDRVLQLYNQDYSVKDFQRWYGIESEILENAAEDSFHEGAPVPESKRSHSIICVANFTRQKNQAALIEAFLRAELPRGWRLDLVGSRETQELARMKKVEDSVRVELGLGVQERPVFYHVGITRKETIELVKVASIYAMSSVWEAFPVSLVEAMSAGVPWVSSDVGIAKYLPGGVVVGDIGDMEIEFCHLAGDSEERMRLGAEGFTYAAEHFRIEEKVTQLERTLLKVIGEMG